VALPVHHRTLHARHVALAWLRDVLPIRLLLVLRGRVRLPLHSIELKGLSLEEMDAVFGWQPFDALEAEEADRKERVSL
jgi:hypothetical protein